MSSNGWIKLHRQFADWEWFTDSNTTHLFLYCLLKANHASNNWKGIEIDAGQFVTSLASLSAATGLSIRNVRTSLKRLKSTREVTQSTTAKYSIISITNWDKYQEGDKQVTRSRHASDKQVTTNKNEKNEKKEKNKELDYSQWPELPDPELLKDWMAMRKRVKASVSQSAINTIGKQLTIAVSAGFTVDQCISEAETRSWKGFKSEWMKNAENNSNSRAGKKADINEYIDSQARSASTRLSGNTVQEVHSDNAAEVGEPVPHSAGRTFEHE